jgi:hypothetical protein
LKPFRPTLPGWQIEANRGGAAIGDDPEHAVGLWNLRVFGGLKRQIIEFFHEIIRVRAKSPLEHGVMAVDAIGFSGHAISKPDIDPSADFSDRENDNNNRHRRYHNSNVGFQLLHFS